MRFFLQFIAIMAVSTLTVVEASGKRKRGLATVHEKCTVPGTFALTFDDGPYNYSWDLAEKLHANGIMATFFINGKNYVDVDSDTDDKGRPYKQVLKHMADLGHQIASHTYEHINIAGKTASLIRYQMLRNEKVIFDAIGKKPVFMRPPEGAYDTNALSVLADLGYEVAMWDIDSLDWSSHNLTTEKSIYKEAIDSEGLEGHISLQHEVYADTANALVDWIIAEYKNKVKFVTVAKCLGMAPYA
ncbi:hypothetical protein BX666DRAFT_1905222 [Dichotomocladium elegans]|nr:hypothetical protein BX666DRAFT_1905222 [Dichotomocladium elegans]